MFAKLVHLAKPHYSPDCRTLFTCLLLLYPIGLTAGTKTKVIKIHALDATHHFQPNPKQVLAMVESGVKRLSSQSSPIAAWRHFISTNDIVGLKINTRLGTLSGTRPAVVEAVIQGLIRAGVPKKNIVIWDRELKDLKRTGYLPIARKLGVQLAGARDSGYSTWDTYAVPALHWDLEKGDHLFGKEKSSTLSHTSKLITGRLSAIISIHPPISDAQSGTRGHLQELALSSADNTERFDASAPHLNRAIGELMDRIAFSRSIAPPVFKQGLKTLQINQSTRAAPLHLIQTQGNFFYYYQRVSDNALPAHTAFKLAYETAKEENRDQTLLIKSDSHEWEQIVLPNGRNILKRETLGKEELAQSRLRLHITDALLCQFHHGDQSRPDFATALNELWFSEDPVALDTLSYELIAQLRSSLNLPVRSNPRGLLGYAAKMMLGTDSIKSMQIETIRLRARASE